MTLCTNNHQTTQLGHTFTQFNIRTTAGHIGGNGYRSLLSCISYNLSLHLMEFGIKDFMRYTLFLQKRTDLLRSFDGNRAHQHRLSLFMGFNNCINHRIYLLFMGFINCIVMVLTNHRFIRWNFDNIHSINIAEFLFFSQGRTGHTTLFGIFIEKVLERDRSQCFTLTSDLHTFFGFNSLMKPIGITSSRHNTSCKLIHNKNFIVLNHIIFVSGH